METICVHLAERSYPIEISSGNLAEAGRFLAARAKTEHVVLLTDDHVHKPHAMAVAESIGRQEIEVDVIVVEPGEEAKSLDVAASLWQGLLDLDADRKTVVAAVGGGVIGDLAGFIAATYARGLRWLQFPTSLLAQVDSSVGGKVGINLPEAKNILGAFHQPLGVLIDTDSLGTLPEEEYRAGLAEVVKCGAALDATFFEYLETNAAAIRQRHADALGFVIARCCRLKADIVERDEQEQSGLRAVLNFGHTFGHAFEMLSRRGQGSGGRGQGSERGEGGGERGEGRSPIPNPQSLIPVRDSSFILHPSSFPSNPQSPIPNPLRHGEAVAIGMVLAARLAERFGRVESPLADRIAALLEAFGLPVEAPRFDAQQVLDVMGHDKKAQRGEFRLVLPARLGHAELAGGIGGADILAFLASLS
jgi:3-dehydroquinate synthase